MSYINGQVFYKNVNISKQVKNKLYIESYKNSEIIVEHSINILSSQLDYISIQHKHFKEEFQPPNFKEINILWDGSEIEIDPTNFSISNNILTIELMDLKNNRVGILKPGSKLDVIYPIHCIRPSRDVSFESEIIYLSNTYPLSKKEELRPNVPVIETIHLKRKIRIGKEVLAIGDVGNYKITITIENIGDEPILSIIIADKVPDEFEYGNFSIIPKKLKENGYDKLIWDIDIIKNGEKLEIVYMISGFEEYKPEVENSGVLI